MRDNEIEDRLRELKRLFKGTSSRLAEKNTFVHSCEAVQKAFKKAIGQIKGLNRETDEKEFDKAKQDLLELEEIAAKEEMRLVHLTKSQRKAMKEDTAIPEIREFGFEQVNIKLSEEKHYELGRTFLQTTRVDQYHGETSSIDGLWIFRNRIDPENLKTGIELLISEIPSLAGRINTLQGGIALNNRGVRFTLKESTGSWKQLPVEIPKHEGWLDLPLVEDMFSGDAPIMTVVLTQLKKGGSVLGVCVSQMAVGINAFANYLMPRLAFYARTLGGSTEGKGEEIGEIKCVEQRSMLPKARRSKDETKKLIETKLQEERPISFNDPLFGPISRSVYFVNMKETRDKIRTLVHFDKDELEHLVSAASEEHIGISKVSKGEALVQAAHIGSVICEVAPQSMLKLNTLGFYIDNASQLKHLPLGLLANTTYLYSVIFRKRMNDLSLSEILNEMHQQLEAQLTDSRKLQEEMAIEEDLLAHRYEPGPRLNMENTILCNNQENNDSLIKLDFGSGECERYIPNNSGDAMLFVPAKDGGIDAWISVANIFRGDIELFETPKVQEKLHTYRL